MSEIIGDNNFVYRINDTKEFSALIKEKCVLATTHPTSNLDDIHCGSISVYSSEDLVVEDSVSEFNDETWDDIEW